MMTRQKAVWGWYVALALCGAPAAFAQGNPPQQPPQQPQQPQPQPQAAAEPEKADPDVRVDPLQPDFMLGALPTTLRLPHNKLSFVVTHRFNRSLGRGDLGDLLSDFFGFDSGAQIGLGLRYGLLPGTQIGIYRTSDRTIQVFGQQSVLQQKADGRPLSVDVLVALEGQNNLHANQSGSFALIVSRKFSGVVAAYVEPIFIANSNFIDNPGDDNNTAMIGLGARIRVRPKVYLVGELTPRVAGYQPGVNQGTFGVEIRSGGHLFQINFSNGIGTTLGQIARGGIDNNSWFIGFNISRKFF